MKKYIIIFSSLIVMAAASPALAMTVNAFPTTISAGFTGNVNFVLSPDSGHTFQVLDFPNQASNFAAIDYGGIGAGTYQYLTTSNLPSYMLTTSYVHYFVFVQGNGCDAAGYSGAISCAISHSYLYATSTITIVDPAHLDLSVSGDVDNVQVNLNGSLVQTGNGEYDTAYNAGDAYDFEIANSPTNETCTFGGDPNSGNAEGTSTITLSCVHTTITVTGDDGASGNVYFNDSDTGYGINGTEDFWIIPGTAWAITTPGAQYGSCDTSNGNGDGNSDQTATITCTPDQYQVTIVVSGANGSMSFQDQGTTGQEWDNVGNGTYTESSTITWTDSTNVIILSNPSGQFCTASPTNVSPTADLETDITCNSAATISISPSAGLDGSAAVILGGDNTGSLIYINVNGAQQGGCGIPGAPFTLDDVFNACIGQSVADWMSGNGYTTSTIDLVECNGTYCGENNNPGGNPASDPGYAQSNEFSYDQNYTPPVNTVTVGPGSIFGGGVLAVVLGMLAIIGI